MKDTEYFGFRIPLTSKTVFERELNALRLSGWMVIEPGDKLTYGIPTRSTIERQALRDLFVKLGQSGMSVSMEKLKDEVS